MAKSARPGLRRRNKRGNSAAHWGLALRHTSAVPLFNFLSQSHSSSAGNKYAGGAAMDVQLNGGGGGLRGKGARVWNPRLVRFVALIPTQDFRENTVFQTKWERVMQACPSAALCTGDSTPGNGAPFHPRPISISKANPFLLLPR